MLPCLLMDFLSFEIRWNKYFMIEELVTWLWYFLQPLSCNYEDVAPSLCMSKNILWSLTLTRQYNVVPVTIVIHCRHLQNYERWTNQSIYYYLQDSTEVCIQYTDVTITTWYSIHLDIIMNIINANGLITLYSNIIYNMPTFYSVFNFVCSAVMWIISNKKRNVSLYNAKHIILDSTSRRWL